MKIGILFPSNNVERSALKSYNAPPLLFSARKLREAVGEVGMHSH